jgi:hypothetical protein
MAVADCRSKLPTASTPLPLPAILYDRFPPNCDVRGRDLLCPLHVDSSPSRWEPSSDFDHYRGSGRRPIHRPLALRAGGASQNNAGTKMRAQACSRPNGRKLRVLGYVWARPKYNVSNINRLREVRRALEAVCWPLKWPSGAAKLRNRRRFSGGPKTWQRPGTGERGKQAPI